ncbi:MAG: hypothetical protein JKX80_02660 [Candidatus Pacebacteria bacterium]|nr:hypothetical protein [Candidatus Paceibacterota bacterium]
MEQDIQTKFEEVDAKLNAIWKSVEKTRKYFLVIIWGSVLMVVLPAIGLLFAIPKFINSYVGALDGLL